MLMLTRLIPMHNNPNKISMPKLWAIIPAAGTGQRFSKTELKQYQMIHNKTVLQHSVQALSGLNLAGCVIALHAEDHYAKQLDFDIDVTFCIGGKERMDSVLSALLFLQHKADPHDYILVHDAARPCLHQDICHAIQAFCQTQQTAGIVAIPVRDTLKKADNNQILNTVNRENMWQAQTPQIVKYAVLCQALQYVQQNQIQVTDEASALEQCQIDVQLILGRNDNLKITYPEDLKLAELILKSHHR